jgi:uncharacterized membrane protein
MMASGVLYFVAEGPAATFERLGFPDYFRIELGVAKIVGALVLLAPLPRAVKEWTYAGFSISFVSAGIAHLAVGDPIADVVPPVIALGLLLTSYAAYRQYRLGTQADRASSA